MAPVISIKDTGTDQTSKVSVNWEAVSTSEGTAVGVAGNVSLAMSLMSKDRPPVLKPAPPSKSALPDGASPVDHYFPADIRNEAPIVTLDEKTNSVRVVYEAVDVEVAGVSANSVDSVAFWKKKSYKWAGDDELVSEPEASTIVQEVMDSSRFERYYPTKVRNFAPAMEMKPPKGDWDTSAYFTLKSDYVTLDETTATAILADPQLQAAAKKVSV